MRRGAPTLDLPKHGREIVTDPLHGRIHTAQVLSLKL